MTDKPRWWWSSARKAAWQAEQTAMREAERDRHTSAVVVSDPRLVAAAERGALRARAYGGGGPGKSGIVSRPEGSGFVPAFVPVASTPSAASGTSRCAGGGDAPQSSGWSSSGGSSDGGGSCSGGSDGGGGGGE